MGLNLHAPRVGMGLAALLVIAGTFGAWRLASQAPAGGVPGVPMTVAIPTQLSAGAFLVAKQNKLFAQHGLAVQLKQFLIGKQALQAMLDGSADLAVVADTPFMLAVLRGERIATLATVYESRKSMAIVGHRDSGVSDAASLDGKRVGTILGTNAEFFLDTMLDVHGISRAKVQVIDLKPNQAAAAFRSRQVDAVTVWNPDLARLEQEFGQKAVTVYGEDLFVYRFLLVGKRDYIDRHGPQLQQLLITLRQANNAIKEHPDQARAQVGAVVGLAPDLLKYAFDPSDFTMVLDQSLLLALSAQMRWASAKGLAASGPAPDYQDFVRSAPLSAVAPEANRIIR